MHQLFVHRSASTGHDGDLSRQPATAGVRLNKNLTSAQQAAVTDAVIAINAGREAIPQ